MSFEKISGLKTLIRADSSAAIGHGHIRRDLVLAQKIKDASFACVRAQGDIADEINFPLFELKSGDVSELIALINEQKFKLAVVDHYGIDFDGERALCERTDAKILCFDDYYRAHYCDILLNVNLFANPLKYATLVPHRCEIWCGREFMLVRDEFYAERAVKREKIYDYFVAFGGTDTLNLSLKTAQILLQKGHKIALITTSANENLSKLKILAQTNANLSLFVDSTQIARLMNESGELIISASSLANEALVLGAKFSAVKTAQNQDEMFAWLKKNGYAAFEADEIYKI